MKQNIKLEIIIYNKIWMQKIMITKKKRGKKTER